MLAFGFVDSTDIVGIALMVAVLAVQLLLCFKGKRKVVRLIPVFVFLFLTVASLVMVYVLESWSSLGFFLLAVGMAALLGVCCLGWIIFGITALIKKRKARSE